MSDKKSEKAKIVGKAKIRAMNKILDALMDEEDILTVADAAEVLMACNNAVKERTYNAMSEEEGKPLSEAMGHLKKPKILKPGVNDIKHVGNTKIH